MVKNKTNSEIVYFNFSNKDRAVLNSEFNIDNNLTIITTRHDTFIKGVLNKCTTQDRIIIDGIKNLSPLSMMTIYEFFLKNDNMNIEYIC